MSAFAPLKHRAFKDLWLGQAISMLGDAFYYVIFMFMVGKVTGDPRLVGLVAAAEMLPFLLLGPYAGTVVDRMDRRLIMLWSDLASLAILVLFLLALFVTPSPPFWALILTPFLLSCVRVFFLPAKSAAVPRLVPAADLQAATGLSMMTQSMMPLIGLALSASVLGALYEVAPRLFFEIAVGLNAASFAISAWFLARVPAIVPERDSEPQHPIQDMKDAWTYVRNRHELKLLLVLSGLMNLSIAPFFLFYLQANKDWFGGKPGTLAWFEFAFFLGMLIGSIAVTGRNVVRPGVAYGISLALCGGTVAAMAFSPNVPAFVFWNFAAGIVLPFAQVPMSTYLQLAVEDGYRGRVNSALQIVSAGVMPIGNVLGGFLIGWIGLVKGFLAMGLGMVVIALAGLIDRPFRTMRMPKAETHIVEANPLS